MKNMSLRAHFSDNSCKKISSLILKCIKGTTRTFPRVDLSIPLMHCDPSDLGSMILFLDHSKKMHPCFNAVLLSWTLILMRQIDCFVDTVAILNYIVPVAEIGYPGWQI